MKFVDLQRQYQLHKDAIDGAIKEVLDSSSYIMGPQIAELEGVLAPYVGVDHCITCGSGTEAIQVALMAMGIGVGDEVITVPFTWISTAEAIRLVGATPVFVDICPDTFNLDIEGIEAAITPRTKAIMPVSLFGQMPDYKRIERFGIPVIEDGAQSFGATRDGKRSCGVTLVGTTSFFPAKPFGCFGDGGALFTNDGELADRMRAVRTHGGLVRHHHPYLGMNSRFDTIQAAVLLARWPYFEEEIAARRRFAHGYTEALSSCCRTPIEEAGNTHIYAQYTVRLADRDRVRQLMHEAQIPTAVYYPTCLHEQPVFADLGHKRGDFPAAEAAAMEVLSLPLHPWLTEEEHGRVIDAMLRAATPVAV